MVGNHMDTLRGRFSGGGLSDRYGSGGEPDHDPGDAGAAPEPPPAAIGQDERRMQVRAYNFWASLLDNRSFPSIDTLDPAHLPDFGPHSVLLDFSRGEENPEIRFLGERLAQECGADGPIRTLADVPGRSLLSRITDHYMQILGNQAPIGFEAEFVNRRDMTILYRGILLPFSSDDATIDFIYGVINWKELADQRTTDELLLEIDQALETKPDAFRAAPAMTAWADGPVDMNADMRNVLDLVTPLDDGAVEADLPQPAFGGDAGETPREPGGDAPAPDADLADWLASARALAGLAQGSEERSRHALYAAIGRAYDFSLAAATRPDEFAALLAEAGIRVQERAPLTPVVKLVFGGDYDKTRITEYATVLSHAHRAGIGPGALAGYLLDTPGGLKGVVAEERRRRASGATRPARRRDQPGPALARKLRRLDHAPLSDLAHDGHEFTLLVARRLPEGEVVLLGEIDDDAALIERAARKLVN